MKKRLAKNRFSTGLTYESLESRQLLALFSPTLATTFHLPQDGSATILTGLDAAPEIEQQPEHGEVRFDSSDGTLTYHPDPGYFGGDTFRIDGASQNSIVSRYSGTPSTYTMRIWEPVYAVPDWTHLQSGTSITADVLANDYSLFPNQYDQVEWQQDASKLKIVQVSGNAFGSVSISKDGQRLIYTASDQGAGVDVVSYTIEDASGHRSESYITFDVSETELEGRAYHSDAQWLQQKIEGWMQRYAGTLTNSAFYYPEIFSIDRGIVFTSLGQARISDTAVFAFATATESEISNNQVEGVQEGDIVKANGDMIYYVTHDQTGESQFASYLSIIDLSDANSPKLVNTIGFEGYVQDLYLDGDRAAVVMQQRLIQNSFFDVTAFSSFVQPDDLDFDLLVLDVSDAEKPAEVYRATVDGQYTDARLIGDQLYVVSHADNDSGQTPWHVAKLLENEAVSPGDFIDAILEMENGFGLPAITIEAAGESRSIDVGAQHVIRRDAAIGSAMVTTFDLQSESGEPIDVDLVEMNPVQTVYASNAAIYLFDGESVVKFDFVESTGGVDFAADGELRGSILSQLAADEHDGYLRVAITDSSDGSSDIRVLSQIDDALVVTASLEDIAPGERIYATHFYDDQVFVVTFRQIDPLFVIDLSDPATPKILGELKIPGFSNHLQFIGDNLLLAVGRDANPNTGFAGSLQVSLFDVSDSSEPQLLDRYTFEGGRSTKTPLVEWFGGAPEHHAMTFDPSTGTLALPIYSVPSWLGADSGSLFEGDASAIALLHVDRESGIYSSGQVDFTDRALRTILVDEHMVFLSENFLKTAERTNPSEVLATISVPSDAAMIADSNDETGDTPNELPPPPADLNPITPINPDGSPIGSLPDEVPPTPIDPTGPDPNLSEGGLIEPQPSTPVKSSPAMETELDQSSFFLCGLSAIDSEFAVGNDSLSEDSSNPFRDLGAGVSYAVLNSFSTATSYSDSSSEMFLDQELSPRAGLQETSSSLTRQEDGVATRRETELESTQCGLHDLLDGIFAIEDGKEENGLAGFDYDQWL